MNNPIALITGGTSGIGAACAYELSSRGYTVIVTGKNRKKGLKFANDANNLGANIEFMGCDVRSHQEITKLFNDICNKYGCLDVAVNNAGIEGAISTKFSDYPENAWHEVISVNLTGVWLCMQQELKIMERQGHGIIVNMSSLAGLRASVTAGCGYTASKHGIIGLTKSAALDYANIGIRVNAVCPGIVNTEGIEEAMSHSDFDSNFHPIGRFCETEEVAKVVAWLCSKESSFINGVSVPIDGGYLAK